MVAAMQTDYLERFSTMPPRNGIYIDTQMEENGWTAEGLVGAWLFLENHPLAYGAPVVMVSADEAGCEEAQQFLGDVEMAPTKRGLGRNQAISKHPADACDLIREKATAALARLSDFTPFTRPAPYELEVTCYTAEQAQVRAAKNPVAQMQGDRSHVVRVDTPLDLLL